MASWFEQQAYTKPALVNGGTAQPRTVDPSGMMLLGGSPAAGRDGVTPMLAPSGGGGGGWSAFDQMFPGSTLTPQQLAANEAQLARAGFRLLGPNSAGLRTKVEFNGRTYDVIGGASSGRNIKQRYDDGPTGGGGMAQPQQASNKPYNPANSKGFQFRMKEGLQAIQRSAAAKGTLLTGGTLKDLNSWAQGLAAGEFDADFNRLSGMASVGGAAAGNQANAYGQTGSNLGSLYGNTGAQLASGYQGIGNAQAGGTVGAGNAWNGAIGNLGNIAQGALFNYGANRPQTNTPQVGYPHTTPPFVPGQYPIGY
jgi:hypothetical protein